MLLAQSGGGPIVGWCIAGGNKEFQVKKLKYGLENVTGAFNIQHCL